MWCVFLAALSVKLNVFCCFSTLYFNHTNLSSLLASIKGEIDICAHGPFYTKFNSEQLLFDVFFHVSRIFGVSILCAYWHINNTGYVDCNAVIICCPLQIGLTWSIYTLWGEVKFNSTITFGRVCWVSVTTSVTFLFHLPLNHPTILSMNHPKVSLQKNRRLAYSSSTNPFSQSFCL